MRLDPGPVFGAFGHPANARHTNNAHGPATRRSWRVSSRGHRLADARTIVRFGAAPTGDLTTADGRSTESPQSGSGPTSAHVKVFRCRPLRDGATGPGGRRLKTSGGGNRGAVGLGCGRVRAMGIWRGGAALDAGPLPGSTRLAGVLMAAAQGNWLCREADRTLWVGSESRDRAHERERLRCGSMLPRGPGRRLRRCQGRPS